jgi:hypothetical protein
MITLRSYWLGRDSDYADQLTAEINLNAQNTVAKVNELLVRAARTDITTVASGWRPKGINDATANASKNSRHLTGQACDLPDPDSSLAEWCVDNLDVLKEIGLWLEDPRWTPGWLHVQTVPPKSGRLVYIPNGDPPSNPDFPVTWIV